MWLAAQSGRTAPVDPLARRKPGPSGPVEAPSNAAGRLNRGSEVVVSFSRSAEYDRPPHRVFAIQEVPDIRHYNPFNTTVSIGSPAACFSCAGESIPHEWRDSQRRESTGVSAHHRCAKIRTEIPGTTCPIQTCRTARNANRGKPRFLRGISIAGRCRDSGIPMSWRWRPLPRLLRDFVHDRLRRLWRR